MKKIIAIAAAAMMAFSAPALAADKYAFDAAHTQVIFSANHLGFSFSHGRFGKIDGSFTFDEKTPAQSAIDVTIDANSIDMGTEAWDKHMKSADFLNVEKFPSITFKSTGIEVTGEKAGKVTGDLTLLGVTKPVTLDVTYNGSGVHPYSKNQIAGFSAKGSFKRSDFGMEYGLPNVGDEISLIIQVEGVRQDHEEVNK